MKTTIAKFIILTVMLLGLPLSGVILTNKPISLYLEFPPRTIYVQHAPFSWPAFLFFSVFILIVVAPFLIQGIKGRKHPGPSRSLPFPWWGWFGIILGIIAWILAWNRFPWLGKFQAHVFTPLWISYIITVNALAYQRRGKCILFDRPLFYMMLFPMSAGFWWFFEYLNRFVQNWYYVGPHFSPWQYFWYATLPFSTVLPAVIGTREWLLGFSWPKRSFQNFLPLRVSHPKLMASSVFLAAGVGLVFIGIWPDYLFSLLWISPLLIIVSLQAIFEERHLFSDITHGDWSTIMSSALAALTCGFFWEMWNVYSLAKWNYSIPLVHRFQIFEMPILGYAGYLPFGLECTVIADLLLMKGKNKALNDPV